MIECLNVGGDPYQKQITECVELVAKEISHQLASDSTRSKEVNAKLSDTVSKLLSGSASAGSGIASGKNGKFKPG